MTRRVIIRRRAKQDLREAKTWYRNISRDLANDFVRRMDEAIARALEWPAAFPIVPETRRRPLTSQNSLRSLLC